MDEKKKQVDENCGQDECAAFSVTPKDGFTHGGVHSILFDHTLISGSDVTSGITFRCGNIMALSAPSKGLPQEGGDGAKYMSFFLEHGEKITKEWFDEVNSKLTEKGIKTPINYKEIDSLKGEDYKEHYKELHDKLADEVLPSFLKDRIFNKPNWELKEKEAEIKKTLNDYFLGDDAKKSKKYIKDGRLDKAYQLLFYNKLWQTQKFGGFDAGKNGPYGVFYKGLVDETGKMMGEAAKKLKEFIEQSIKGVDGAEKPAEEPDAGGVRGAVDVLFLCESVHHLDEILGDEYKCVSIKKTNDEIYSAIWKEGSVVVEAIQGKGTDEYGIFTIKKGEKSIKVAVVHTKEKVVKNEEKKVTGPNKSEWETFIKNLEDVNYMVGDTNMTKKKSKLKDDDGDGSKKAFWESLAKQDRTKLVEDAVLPTRPIKKVRLGISSASEVNGFLNNQINKGGDPASEVDGMVILKLSGGGGQGGGRRRQRRKTKKKRKSKRKSKRKRKPKRKTKRKRKRRRTKKR